MSTTEKIRITLPKIEGLPPLPNTTRGQHWAEAHKTKTQWTEYVAWLAKRECRTISMLITPVNVHFHISVGSNRRIDPDNINWAVTKPSLDGLVMVGVLEDDSIDHITLSYSYDRAEKGFTITLEEL